MLKSKHLLEFEKLKQKEINFTLYTDRILVEKLPPFEAISKSGLITHTETSNRRDHFDEKKAHFVVTLLVGQGYFDSDTQDTIPLEVKPGDVLMVPAHSTHWLTQFGLLANYERGDIGLTTEPEVHFNFGPIKNFEKFFDVLNEKV